MNEVSTSLNTAVEGAGQAAEAVPVEGADRTAQRRTRNHRCCGLPAEAAEKTAP